jgi:hypothetical protein
MAKPHTQSRQYFAFLIIDHGHGVPTLACDSRPRLIDRNEAVLA